MPKETYKYALTISNDGKINKSIKGAATHTAKGTVNLYYYSKKNKTKSVSILNLDNVLTHQSILDSEFDSFMDIIGNANKIYVIDLSEERETINYKAYEVSF